MRITKSPDERRQEIINTAKELFAANGFAKTSVSDIANKIGIAKGLFYYYFKTKNDVMNAVIEQYLDVTEQRVCEIIQDTGRDYTDRLGEMLRTIIDLSADAEQVFAELKSNDRFMFHQSILEYAAKRLGPAITAMVDEGVQNGIIQCRHPHTTVEILFYGFGMIDFTAMDRNQILEIVAQALCIN